MKLELVAMNAHRPPACHQVASLANQVGVLLLLCEQVSKLEAEAEQLQLNLAHSQQTVKTLERRLAGMEAELVEHQQRVSCQPTVFELLEIC